MMNKCGECHWLVTEEGKPYYCALRDLYTFRDEQDNACSEYVEKDEADNEKLQKTADNKDIQDHKGESKTLVLAMSDGQIL